MKVKEAILKRRSIRKYKNNEISKEIIDELVELLRLSPSAKNSQTWRFKFITDDKTKKLLKENKVFKQDFVCTAPLIVVCCADVESYPSFIGNSEYSNVSPRERTITDLAIASQSLVLRATELGLGTCYVGLLNEEKLKDLLDIPKNYILHYVITIGYSDEEGVKTSRKNIEEILI